MVNHKIDLVVRRLMALKAPKDSWFKTCTVSSSNCTPLFNYDSVGSQDFVLLVLLCSWTTLGIREENWELLDYFCGVGRVGHLAAQVGYKSAACDIKHHQPEEQSQSQKKSGRPMRSRFDSNGEVGFSFPISIYLFSRILIPFDSLLRNSPGNL